MPTATAQQPAKNKISKTDLAFMMCLTDANEQRAYTDKLEPYFTDELLLKLGITKVDYKKIRLFSAKQTKILMEDLKEHIV